MSTKTTLYMIGFTFLLVAHFSVATSSEFLVGVKKGDLMEYDVTCTGEVPKLHDLDRAKIEVVSVEGTEIDIKLTSIYLGGIEENVDFTLNLDTGQIGDAFIIPANLNEGDTFLEQTEGTIAISGVEQRTYAGSKRTVVKANTLHTIFCWDKPTGFLVEAVSKYEDFTITTQAEKTNIWKNSTSRSDPIFSIIIITITLALIILILIRKIKR